MIEIKIKAKFQEFSLPSSTRQDSSVIVPTVRGNLLSKYGVHATYFFNLKSGKGICLKVGHRDIIWPGLKRLREAHSRNIKFLPGLRSLFLKYHYGFNFLEAIMLLTVPHNVTDMGNGRFLVNFWSYFGYLDVDCRNKTVTYRMLDKNEENHVLGSQQWHDRDTDSRFYMTYSLKDSLARAIDPDKQVFSRILNTNDKTGDTKTIWEGNFSDYMHDIHINKTKQYLVACELGMYADKNKNPIPSKVLILDLKNNQHWIINRFIVAAHAQFDPVDPNIIYFSNHNFLFKPSDVITLFKLGTYSINILGPASVFKYRLTPEGPQEIGVYTRPDMFRLTNFHVLLHRGRKILAAMGSPNNIFIADAETFEWIKKIEIKNIKSADDVKAGPPIPVGTISPSFDGEKLFVHTTRSFQIIDVASGEADYVRHTFFNHTCANHMATSHNTEW